MPPTTMTNSSVKCKDRQHLSDIQIAFMLTFNKVKVTQEKIIEYVKCSYGTIQNVLNNYVFETFQGHHKHQEY